MTRTQNGLPGIYNATAQTLSDGNGSALALDSSGNAITTLGTLIEGEDQTFHAMKVIGNVASGAADQGGPVKVGGKYNSSGISLADGQRGDIQLTGDGYQIMSLKNADKSLMIYAEQDGETASWAALRTYSENAMFNGTTWDRVRNNQDVTLLASAGRTTTQTSADLVNYNGMSAIIVVVDMTTVGTGSITFSLDGKDVASGKYYNILTGAAIASNSTNRYRVGHTLTAAANSIAQDYLPRTFRIVITANNANSATYSVGYSLVRG